MSNSTGAMRAPTIRPLRMKHLVFAAIAAMAAYVLYHNERFLIDATLPAWNHYDPFKWWLLPHGPAGACALLLVPMQFAEGFRRRHTAVHRTIGTLYVVAASSWRRSDSTSSISTKPKAPRGPSPSRP